MNKALTRVFERVYAAILAWLMRDLGSTHLPQPQPLRFGSLCRVVSQCANWISFRGNSPGRDNPRLQWTWYSCSLSSQGRTRPSPKQFPETHSGVLFSISLLLGCTTCYYSQSLTNLSDSSREREVSELLCKFSEFPFHGYKSIQPTKKCFWS